MDVNILIALITTIGGIVIAFVNRWPSKLILSDLKAIKSHLGIEVKNGKVLILRASPAMAAEYQDETK
jgi:hypothetical protein